MANFVYPRARTQNFVFHPCGFFTQIFTIMTPTLLSVVLSESRNPGQLVGSLRKMGQLFLKVAPFIRCGLSTTAGLEKGTLFYKEFLFFKEERKIHDIYRKLDPSALF